MPCQPDKYAGPSYPKREKQPGDVRQQDASSAREEFAWIRGQHVGCLKRDDRLAVEALTPLERSQQCWRLIQR